MAGRYGQVAGGKPTELGARLVESVAGALFPHFCLVCGREGSLLCGNCQTARYAPERGFFFCLGCGVRLRRDVSCGRTGCKKERWGHGFSVGSYGDSVLRRLLHLYKYSQVREAGEILVGLMVSAVARQVGAVLSGLECPVLVSVPLHPVNRARRGFNQAEELALPLSVDLEEDFLPTALSRRISWRAQANISPGSGRTDHVRDAFRPGLGAAGLSGRDVLLVDDVFTTGATLRECIRVLNRLGTRRISAITLLRGH